YESTLRAFARTIGLDRLKAVHLNDSKRELGSRVDRHARTGQGHLGVATFRRILNDRRFRGVPLVVETPGPLEEWRKELSRLRRLVAPGARGAGRPKRR